MTDKHDLHDERISKLYKMGSRAEPPKHLDEQIIRVARATGPGRKQRLTWPSLATAAVLVLSISLVLKVLNQTPLEESIMEPLPTDDSTNLAPMMEKEVEEKADTSAPVIKDQDSGRREEPRQDQKAGPERYRAKQQSPAPAPTIQGADTMGAARVEPAPASLDKLESRKRKLLKLEAVPMAITATPESATGKALTEKLECSVIPLPETASIDVWRQRYKTALEQGQSKTAECLKRAFYSKFGKAIQNAEQSGSGPIR